MFPYTDPAGSDRLEAEGALDAYRRTLQELYVKFARLPDSAFTLLEAFEEAGIEPEGTGVEWIAFPRTSPADGATIDRDRFTHQDEYVEWRVERSAGGAVERITFCTEFPEYFEALAQVGTEALQRGVQDAIPGAAPSITELFGPNFDPGQATPAGRASQFRLNLRRNPWNTGIRGILCLTQRFNTLHALFNLLGQCAVRNGLPDAGSTCANVGGACGPDRNSDPAVCTAAQDLARAEQVMAAADPAGIRIVSLDGIWKVDGQQIDVNDPDNNQDVWRVQRNGRRAVLHVGPNVTLDDAPITSGAQVSRVLFVRADVVFARGDQVPAWARTGQESTRGVA